MDAQLYQQEGKKLSSKLRGPLCPTLPYCTGTTSNLIDLSFNPLVPSAYKKGQI